MSSDLTQLERFIKDQLLTADKLLEGIPHDNPERDILRGRKIAYREILSVIRGDWVIAYIH